MPPIENALATRILDALKDATTPDKFDATKFFQAWFLRPNDALFFLFRKNLSVTNIQFAELIGLLRQHAKHTSGEPVSYLSFTSPRAFKTSVSDHVNQLLESTNDRDRALRTAVELYAPLLESLAVIRPYYCSCAVYLPPHLKVDLATICGLSGYVHSCGPAVYTRRISRASKRELFAALNNHLIRYSTAGRKVFFAPYSHEDFSKFDKNRKHVRDELKQGLDDVKIHVEKAKMGPFSLSAVIEEMREAYKDQLTIAEGGNYQVKHPAQAENTLWLINDSAINTTDGSRPGRKTYYICYDQRYYNDSPFTIFDENKPGWISHTTIPHTLMAAMINATKPWRSEMVVKIVDPFAGTGTTLLELAKEENVSVALSDRNPLIDCVIRDNARFFGLNAKQIDDLAEYVGSLLSELPSSGQELTAEISPELFPGPVAALEWANKILKTQAANSPNLEDAQFSEDVITELSTADFNYRIVFYLTLKAWIRKKRAYERRSLTRIEAFRETVNDAVEELRAFSEWRSRAETAKDDRGKIVIFAAKYSNRCSPSPKTLAGILPLLDSGHAAIRVGDARALSVDSCDLILTDPPYGFNTEEELEGLARLYAEMISCFVSALRDGGQLVMCLPERSKAGGLIPYFAKAEAVIPQVIAMARATGKEVVTQVNDMAFPGQGFAPPFYWQSEKALYRSIVRFRFRNVAATLPARPTIKRSSNS